MVYVFFALYPRTTICSRRFYYQKTWPMSYINQCTMQRKIIKIAGISQCTCTNNDTSILLRSLVYKKIWTEPETSPYPKILRPRTKPGIVKGVPIKARLEKLLNWSSRCGHIYLPNRNTLVLFWPKLRNGDFSPLFSNKNGSGPIYRVLLRFLMWIGALDRLNDGYSGFMQWAFSSNEENSPETSRNLKKFRWR